MCCQQHRWHQWWNKHPGCKLGIYLREAAWGASRQTLILVPRLILSSGEYWRLLRGGCMRLTCGKASLKWGRDNYWKIFTQAWGRTSSGCPSFPQPPHTYASMWSVLQNSRKMFQEYECVVQQVCGVCNKKTLWALILCTLREKNNDNSYEAKPWIPWHDLSLSISTVISSYRLTELEWSLRPSWISLSGEVLFRNIFLPGVPGFKLIL